MSRLSTDAGRLILVFLRDETMELTEATIGTIRDASKALTGARRRRFQADVALKYLDGSPTRAERVFGWSRHTVTLGLNELRTGIECLGAFSQRGNHRWEDKNPKLAEDIRSLVDGHSQADPKFRSTLAWTRLTGEAVRNALIEEKGWKDEDLPGVRTIRDILNRLGYQLRRVQKTKPQKKLPRRTRSSTTCTSSTPRRTRTNRR